MFGMGFLTVIGFIVLAAALGLVIWSGRMPRRPSGTTAEAPEEILRRRYARGEIDVAEFRRRLDELRA
jgi:putative membrane protein